MNNYQNYNYPVQNGDRFFGVPFLVGGIAGTALGYGIANDQNNQNNTYYPVYPTVPVYQTYMPPVVDTVAYPTYSTSNNYYY